MEKLTGSKHSKQKKRTALHEAAHYVTHVLYVEQSESFRDHKPDSISIIPNEEAESLGHIHIDKDFWIFEGQNDVFLKKKHVLAGYASEFILRGKEDFKPFLGKKLLAEADWVGSDASKVIDLQFAYTYDTERDVTDLLLPAFEEVVNELKQHWYLVEKVAVRLLKHNEVKGEQLEILYTEILGSLPNRAT